MLTQRQTYVTSSRDRDGTIEGHHKGCRPGLGIWKTGPTQKRKSIRTAAQHFCACGGPAIRDLPLWMHEAETAEPVFSGQPPQPIVPCFGKVVLTGQPHTTHTQQQHCSKNKEGAETHRAGHGARQRTQRCSAMYTLSEGRQGRGLVGSPHAAGNGQTAYIGLPHNPPLTMSPQWWQAHACW